MGRWSWALASLLAVVVVPALLADDPADPPRPAAAAIEQCVPRAGDQTLAGNALLHVPAGRTPVALVLAFHGAGGDGPGMAGYSGLSATADKHGFAVLYPSAAAHRFWELNRKMGTRDIDALKALLPTALTAACVDATHVFATGVSNGGGFAARVGCELPVAAIAPVAGGYRALDPCPSSARTSVLEIHGTADTVVPYNGQAPDYAGSVPRYLRGWARRDNCGRPVTSHPRRGLTILRYRCAAGRAINHLKLAGTDHGWPGAGPPFPRHNPTGLNANEAIWAFFAAHLT